VLFTLVYSTIFTFLNYLDGTGVHKHFNMIVSGDLSSPKFRLKLMQFTSHIGHVITLLLSISLILTFTSCLVVF